MKRMDWPCVVMLGLCSGGMPELLVLGGSPVNQALGADYRLERNHGHARTRAKFSTAIGKSVDKQTRTSGDPVGLLPKFRRSGDF